VYVLDANNLVKNHEITVMELTAGQFYVVTSGLKANDKIVYDGTISLKDSTKIAPQAMPTDKVYQGLNN
jgi:membrane fusion protein (multidrug efflux system)